MVDTIYLKAPDNTVEDTIDANAVAAEIIDLIENGAPADYKGFAQGEKLERPQILGIVQHGSNSSRRVLKVYRQIMQEKKKFVAVRPFDYNTESQYKSALSAEQKYLDVDLWYDGMKAHYEVTTFTQLINATKPAGV